jgi:hypothetical protein
MAQTVASFAPGLRSRKIIPRPCCGRTHQKESQRQRQAGQEIYTNMVRDRERQGQGKRCMIIIVYEEHILQIGNK